MLSHGQQTLTPGAAGLCQGPAFAHMNEISGIRTSGAFLGNDTKAPGISRLFHSRSSFTNIFLQRSVKSRHPWTFPWSRDSVSDCNLQVHDHTFIISLSLTLSPPPKCHGEVARMKAVLRKILPHHSLGMGVPKRTCTLGGSVCTSNSAISQAAGWRLAK